MIRRQEGQTFILILILLAVGALLIVPTLRLSSAALSNSRIVTRQVKSLYAADAAQEWILWKLTYDDLGSEFTEDGQTIEYTKENGNPVNVCGVLVDVTIIMRALEGEGGMTLAGDDVIRPMKTVIPDTVPDGNYRTYTYTIRLEQFSDDNSVGLDAVYDILPDEFGENDYVPGRSTISVDGGAPEPIADPSKTVTGGQVRLQWPASYDYLTETGGFTSPIRDFEVRQVKELSFQVAGTMKNDRTYYNWVVLKPWNTISGPVAPIITGNGNTPEGGLIQVSKVADPELIQPGVETDIVYAISITNLENLPTKLRR